MLDVGHRLFSRSTAEYGASMGSGVVCLLKQLLSDQLVEAGERALRLDERNGRVARTLQLASPHSDIPKEQIAILIGKFWGGSVRLTVSFMDNPPQDLGSRILAHMNACERLAGLCRRYLCGDHRYWSGPNSPAGRQDGGYWSYLATDILQIPAERPTLYGWPVEKTISNVLVDIDAADFEFAQSVYSIGHDRFAVRRGSEVVFQQRMSSIEGLIVAYGFGQEEDQYLVGDWTGDGKDKLAVRRGNEIMYQRNITDVEGIKVTYGNGMDEDCRDDRRFVMTPLKDRRSMHQYRAR